MQVLSFMAENFKRLRVVEIVPKGRVIQLTGRNGQGKTSVLDGLWAALQGKRGSPEKPVRKGATKSKITFTLGDGKTGKREIIGTRTFDADRTTGIELRNAEGTKFSSPQALLDGLMGELAFDPLAFIHMEPKQQISALRQASKVDYDFEAANKANGEDFAARTIVNRDVDRLKGEAAAVTVMEGLPKAKIDEAPILREIREIDSVNLLARQIDEAKRQAQANLDTAKAATTNARFKRHNIRTAIGQFEEQINELQKRIAQKKVEEATVQSEEIDPLEASETAIQTEVDAMPSGQFVDVLSLTTKLQEAQTANREIDKREKKQTLETQLAAKEKEAMNLTRQIERRDEKKAEALGKAKLPVEGLTFDENAVLMNGIPIEQLGEAEQLRISTLIAMSANPKLRVLRVMHGEALDDENLAVLAQLAEEHDFQIWMARVDSSGKVGIVMEDGEVKTVNDDDSE